MTKDDKYTDPKLREEVKEDIHKSSKGGAPGQWTARKAQLMASEYKKKGGDYTTDKKDDDQKHIQHWDEDDQENESKTESETKSKSTTKNEKQNGSKTSKKENEKKQSTRSQPKRGGNKQTKKNDEDEGDDEEEDDEDEEDDDAEKSKSTGKKRKSDNKESQSKKQKTNDGNDKKDDSDSHGKQASASRLPKTGQTVHWKALPGWVEGDVVEIVTSTKTIEGKSVKASKDDPRIALRSHGPSNKIAVHKPEAVYF